MGLSMAEFQWRAKVASFSGPERLLGIARETASNARLPMLIGVCVCMARGICSGEQGSGKRALPTCRRACARIHVQRSQPPPNFINGRSDSDHARGAFACIRLSIVELIWSCGAAPALVAWGSTVPSFCHGGQPRLG